MSQEILKPMGIGRMIDVSFQLYRKHFMKLMSIILICYGLIYLLQAMTQGQTLQSLFNMDELRNYSAGDLEPLLVEGGQAWVVFLFGLAFLFLTPVVVASIVFLVHHVMQGKEVPSALQLLRMSFKRYGGLLGSSIVFGLMMLGFIFTIAIATMILSVIVAVLSEAAGGVWVVLVIVGMLFAFYYFTLRFVYFLPVVAFKEESIGVGRSWSLTRGSFWRLFGLFLVMLLIIYLLNLVAGFILGLLPISGVLLALLQMLINVLTAPILYIAYAVSYFDLRVRDGMGLEEMISRIAPDSVPPPPPPINP
ncbi:hypothetical protein [Cohnella cellulosilytica]|uniref:Glycerophosphoryl diester phosphodiesterase membrane domain-containing protein n=1 Tax=Cohnella cellulosilytica TaxID=986710 RepID=A0ABW2FD64_9BACL